MYKIATPTKRLRDWLMADIFGIVFALVAAVLVVAWLTRGPW